MTPSSSAKILKISPAAQTIATENNFIIKLNKFEDEELERRILRVGAIQTSIVASTSDQIELQRDKMFQKVGKLFEAAAIEGVNIMCLPELWYMPYPFHSPDDIEWQKFAEIESDMGSSVNFLKTLAVKFKMLIISSIVERENETFYNTCLVISTAGDVIGKYRKSHIPQIESSLLSPGGFDHLVLPTEFGKIGILICYERHFPLAWMMLGLNEAEIVFNPSSEDEDSLSERLWFVEARSAAAANGFFAVSVNRSGKESFKSGKSFKYFGLNYIASPDGFISESLPRDCDGLLVAEINLNSCQRVKNEFSFHQNQHLETYARNLTEKALKFS